MPQTLGERRDLAGIHLIGGQLDRNDPLLQHQEELVGLFLDRLDVGAPADLLRLLLLGDGALAVVESVQPERVDQLLGKEVLVLVAAEGSLAADNKVKRLRLLDQDDLVEDVLILAGVRQFRQPQLHEQKLLEVVFLPRGRGKVHGAHFPERRRGVPRSLLLLGAGVRARREGVAGFDVDELRVGALVLGKGVNEDVEAGDPKVPVVFLLGPEFVDPFFGDEVELVVLDDLDGVDFWQLDGLLDFLQGFVAVVGEAVLQDQEVPFLPDRDEPR